MATKNAPGKFFRKGISLIELFEMFPTMQPPKRGSSNLVGRKVSVAPIAIAITSH